VNFKLAKEFVVTGFVLLWAAGDGVAAPDASFLEGVEACRAGQYPAAAQAFRNSLIQQPASGTLLNLGISEWRRGRVGEAVLSWEQAALLDPFNHDARNNLLFAREVAQLEPPDFTWYEVASTWLPANTWAWIAGESLWLTVAMVTLPGILRVRKNAWHQSLAALGLVVFLLSIPAYAGVVSRAEFGIVLKKNTQLRLTPTDDAETVATLSAGETARKTRAQGDYYFIRTQRGSGWIEQKQFGLLCPASK
jgi:tetratricopeptide (TPR) repeat protein